MFLEALKISYKAHKGQVRKDSLVPYIVHPLRVSGYFNDDFKKTIAILHDVIEDTDITLEDLKIYFPIEVVKIVDLLSRKKEEMYFDYVKKITKNKIATEIKIVDIIDNLSDTISVHPVSMIDRYIKSLDILIK